MLSRPTILESLRQKGYRITPQREMIVQTIEQSDHHLTAEEIFAEVEKQTRATNIATVYRTLEMLWQEGLARRSDLGEGKIVYAPLEHGPHIHLVCRQCNHVIDADHDLLDSVGERLLTQYQFEADLQHISIFGLCANCQN